MTHTTVRISTDAFDLLRRIAQEDSRSMAAVLRLAIEAYARSRKPVAGVDFDPDKPMCQDDYEYFTQTGQYAPGAPAPVTGNEWTVEQ